MSGITPFSPKIQGTVTITSAVTTASVSLSRALANTVVRVKNIDATNIAYVNFGISTVTATLPSGGTGGSIPVGPNESIAFGISETVTHAAAICSAGTPIVFFTPGNGTL